MSAKAWDRRRAAKRLRMAPGWQLMGWVDEVALITDANWEQVRTAIGPVRHTSS